MDAQVQRLIQLYDRCTDREWRMGRYFYHDAHHYCWMMVGRYGYPLRTVAGVVAALSPNNSWSSNKRSAEAVLAGNDNGVRSYRRDLIRALWIMAGADPDVVLNPETSPKTNAFFQLLNAGWSATHVCIDGHMANIIRGTLLPMKGMQLKRSHYDEYAELIRAAAAKLGIMPCVLQATLWIAWRAGLNVSQDRIA